MRSPSQHGELLIEILVDEGDQRDDRQKQVTYETIHHPGKRGRDAGVPISFLNIRIALDFTVTRIHKADGNLQHIVAQEKVREVVPNAFYPLRGSGAAL